MSGLDTLLVSKEDGEIVLFLAAEQRESTDLAHVGAQLVGVRAGFGRGELGGHQGLLFAGIGGALLGMISVGLAELQEYHLLARCRVPSPVAVATSIFVVVVSVLVASLGHFYSFATSADSSMLIQVLSIVAFTIPGVIIGGQIGPMVQARLNPDIAKVSIAFLFIAVGIFMLVTLAI